jgi:hypothetical protein
VASGVQVERHSPSADGEQFENDSLFGAASPIFSRQRWWNDPDQAEQPHPRRRRKAIAPVAMTSWLVELAGIGGGRLPALERTRSDQLPLRVF